MKTVRVGKNYVTVGKSQMEKSGFVKNGEFSGIQGRIGKFFALFAWPRRSKKIKPK